MAFIAVIFGGRVFFGGLCFFALSHSLVRGGVGGVPLVEEWFIREERERPEKGMKVEIRQGLEE